MKRVKFFLRLSAVWILVLLSVSSLVNYAQDTKVVWDSFVHYGSVDDITRWENRLAALKSQIPLSAGRVGYISSDPQGNEFVLTQYTLIPLVLERGTAPDWIIANYPGKTIHRVLQNQLEIENYTVESYGYGLYLVHRK
jgi:hypothetical protein